MLKKVIAVLFLFFGMFPIWVSASDSPAARIGDNYYDNLEEAIAAAGSTETIVLTSNINLASGLSIDKIVNLNLSGKTITAPSQVFQVQGGTLNLSGSGTIRETEPYYGAIVIKGSTNSSESEYSVVNVGESVTLEGWSGIFISHNSSKSYGVIANFEGKINALDDTGGGEGAGIYVNGNIKDESNHPVINIKDGATINSTGNGLYIAGFSTFNIGDATIVGESSGIGIKAGRLNIDGSSISAYGENSTPTEGNSNGINSSGAAIQIESNTGYAGNIDLNVADGTFTSKKGYVIYEYVGKGTDTSVHSIEITGGTFTSESGLDVFLLSSSLKDKAKEFISGGYFSSNPSPYLKSGYTSNEVTKDRITYYEVVTSAMREITIGNITIAESGTSLIKGILTIAVIVIASIVTYKNRQRILRFINNLKK